MLSDNKLSKYIRDCTRVLLKPKRARDAFLSPTHPVANLAELTIDEERVVDVHFCYVVVDLDKALACYPEILEEWAALRASHETTDLTTFIEIGVAIGNFEDGLRLIALGAVLRMWRVSTPETMGVRGILGEHLAFTGAVFASDRAVGL